jgi:hypothetical protein
MSFPTRNLFVRLLGFQVPALVAVARFIVVDSNCCQVAVRQRQLSRPPATPTATAGCRAQWADSGDSCIDRWAGVVQPSPPPPAERRPGQA